MKILLTSPTHPLISHVLHNILTYDLIPTTDLALSTISPYKVYNVAKQNAIPIVLGDFSAPVADLAAEFAASEGEILFLFRPLPLPPGPRSDSGGEEEARGQERERRTNRDRDDRWTRYHRNAIDAARLAGCVRLIVYATTTTTMATLPSQCASSTHGAEGDQTPQYLDEQRGDDGGLEYVILRVAPCVEDWWWYCGVWDGCPALGVDNDENSNTSDSFEIEEVEDGNSASAGEDKGGGEAVPGEGTEADVEAVDIVIPHDGQIPWVSRGDLSEGIARLLGRLAGGETTWFGRTLTLSGQETARIVDIARLVERYRGVLPFVRNMKKKSRSRKQQRGNVGDKVKVNVKSVGTEEARRYHLEQFTSGYSGINEMKGQKKEVNEKKGEVVEFVNGWIGWFDSLRDGEYVVVDSLLGGILEREPCGIKEACQSDAGEYLGSSIMTES